MNLVCCIMYINLCIDSGMIITNHLLCCSVDHAQEVAAGLAIALIAVAATALGEVDHAAMPAGGALAAAHYLGHLGVTVLPHNHQTVGRARPTRTVMVAPARKTTVAGMRARNAVLRRPTDRLLFVPSTGHLTVTNASVTVQFICMHHFHR